MFLTAAQILGTDDIKYEIVDVPEWPTPDGKPGQVRLRAPMAYEMDAYEDSMVSSTIIEGKAQVVKTTTNAKARLVVRLAVDEKGERIFTDDQADSLGSKSHAAVNRLFQTIQRLSGRTPARVVELEKNLGTGQMNSSGSNSPVI